MKVIGLLLFAAGLGWLCHTLFRQMIVRAGAYEERYLAAADKQLGALFVFIAPEELLRLNLVMAGVFFLGGAMLGLRLSAAGALLLGAAAGGLGFWLPRVVLRLLLARRRKTILQQLPDAMGVVVNGLKAGRALPQAMQMVVDEMPRPISQEFGLLLRERNLGQAMDVCAERLVARVPLTDIRLFAMILKLSMKMGGDVTEPLQNAAQTIRNRFMVEKKVKALTSQVRFQGIMVACMPFFIFLMLSWMAPELMKPIMGTAAGYVVLAVVLTLQAIGGICMWKVSQIKY